MYHQELCGNRYFWEQNTEITWTFHIDLFQKLSQQKEVMDILYLILPVKVLCFERNKYCLNLSVLSVEEEEMTANTFDSLQGWV